MSDANNDFNDDYSDDDLGFEKSSGLRRTIANIPPAARWTMVAIVVVCVIATISFVKNLGSTPDGLAQPQTQGRADINIDLGNRQIKKTDNNEVKNTETGAKLADLRDQNIENKRQNQKNSFIERLELKNEERVAVNLQKDKEELDRRESSVVTMNSDVAARRIEERKRVNLENQAKLRNEIAIRQNQRSGSDTPKKGDSTQNGLYYFDETGNLVINSMPVSQADLLSLQMTGQILDDEKLYEDQMDKAKEERVDGLSIADIGYVPHNPSMKATVTEALAQNRQNGQAQSSPASSNRDYFSRGINAVKEEKDNMRNMHDRLTSNTSGQEEGSGGFGGYSSGGGVSSYDRPENEDVLDIAPGEMFYSILDIGVNTDEISPVRATVVQEGLLRGAVLLGMPAKIGDKAVIQFSTMTVNKRSYSVDVVAVDPETWRTAIADDVNHHRFTRYAGLIGAAALSGYAEALTSSRTVTRSDGSTETIRDRLPDADDQALYAAGSVGEVLVPKMESAFDRDSTVRVFENRDVGIMFMSGLNL